MDQFVECGEEMTILSSDEQNGKINDIARLTDSNNCKWVNIHGNAIIKSMDNREAIIEWTIRNNMANCQIGLFSSYKMGWLDPDYSWYGVFNIKDSFGIGDTIKLVLNIAAKNVIYYKNDKISKISYGNVDVSKEYHLAIKVFTSSISTDNVQLIDFNVKNCNSLSFHCDQ